MGAVLLPQSMAWSDKAATVVSHYCPLMLFWVFSCSFEAVYYSSLVFTLKYIVVSPSTQATGQSHCAAPTRIQITQIGLPQGYIGLALKPTGANTRLIVNNTFFSTGNFLISTFIFPISLLLVLVISQASSHRRSIYRSSKKYMQVAREIIAF